ncbi:MAG: biotin/lipoyl-containing protein [Pseudomonadota bacterium]
MTATTYYVSALGEEHAIALTPQDDGSYVMTLDGRERRIDARAVSGDLLSMLIDGVSYDVDLERGKPRGADDLATHVNVRVHGAVVAAEVLDARRHGLRELAGQSQSKGGRQEVCAPMPGKVVKILVDKGATVKAGQGLIVVEAMKMENEILSSGDGTVIEVRAQAGVAVESGAVLVVVE